MHKLKNHNYKYLVVIVYLKNILIKKLKVMKTTKLLSIAVLVGSLFIGQSLLAQSKMSKKEDTKMVGGAAMYPSKNIVENAVNSKDHTTLVAAVKAAELVDVLSSDGPFTVFAPTNAAFDKLPKGTVETLVQPENKEQLQTILKYHVVSGNWNAMDLAKAIKDNKGKAVIKTVSGGTITAWMDGKDVYISDENGNKAKVTIADVKQSNGVIHVIDTVLLPKS